LAASVALVVEQQAILAAAEHQVQADAQVAQVFLAALRPGPCLPGNDAVFSSSAQVAVAGRLGNPENDLQVAQAARRSLQLGSRLNGVSLKRR
jgi:FPC/CPF motif-containing protein YcgG